MFCLIPVVHHQEAPPMDICREAMAPTLLVVLAILVLLVVIVKAQLYKASLDDLVPYDFFVPREGWDAKPSRSALIPMPPATLAVIKHTRGPKCLTHAACKARVKAIQMEHMEVFGLPDISYNFLIGGDELIYIGRGWGVQNGGRNDSLDVAFIGDFNIHVPGAGMLSLARRILIFGPREGGLDYSSYHVVNHNQTEPTESPGANLYKEIVHFNHYSNAVCYTNSTAGIIIDHQCPEIFYDSDYDDKSDNLNIFFWLQ